MTREEVAQGDSDRVLSCTTFIYDALSRLTEARNNDATVTYEYDDASRVTAETINGRRTEYNYDPDQIRSRSAPLRVLQSVLPVD